MLRIVLFLGMCIVASARVAADDYEHPAAFKNDNVKGPLAGEEQSADAVNPENEVKIRPTNDVSHENGAAGPFWPPLGFWPGNPAPDPSPGTGSSLYIRWGRTVCPESASLVYEGLVGGGYYTHAGGSANYLCLPETPEYDEFQSGNSGYRGVVYSAEYFTSDFTPLLSKHNHDVPCAMCRVSTRGSIAMLPAKMTCPQGWTREYHGYLMGSRYNEARGSELVCVDRDPEVVPGSNARKYGALLYPVEGRCNAGNLPCAPYVEGHELTCVVCTM